jgi:SAM-dependent methyltransferase
MRKNFYSLPYKILNSRFFSKFFRSYKITWELAGITKGMAMDAVLRGVKNETEFWSSGKDIAEKLRKFIDKNSIVLDVGCGLGRIEKYLAEHCKEIHAVDISSRMIKFAKEYLKGYENVFFYVNNGKDLRIFPDEKFHFCFSILVLQHLEKEDAFNYIEEIHRVLKPGGKVYLQFPNFLSEKVFRWFVDYAKKGSRHVSRVRGYTVPEVEKIMNAVGFTNLEIRIEGDEAENIVVVGTKV